jgi:uncharacterized protein (TIGR00266 family)
MSDHWYYAQGQERVGPMSQSELIRKLPSLEGKQTKVYGPGLSNWTNAGEVPELRDAFEPRPAKKEAPTSASSAPAPKKLSSSSSGSGSSSKPSSSKPKKSHEIDVEVFGNEMQYVVVTLDVGETVMAEPGGMMYMTEGIDMSTKFGDPNKEKSSFFDKMKTAGKRALTGESMFVTTFTNTGRRRAEVGFAAPYPGKIIPFDLDEMGGEMICQKDSFLCAAKGTEISIAFQKKIGVGLFGGEGFIMQKLRGDGFAVIHAGGTLMERELDDGETIRVDTGCIVAFQPSIEYDIKFVGGFKNTIFGGEGLFFATLTGPGRIWLQSLPFSRLAGRVLANAGGSGKDEGSVLGGIGRMLGGD